MKLCKDCKYCKPLVTKFLWVKFVNYELARCSHELSLDLVSGEPKLFCDLSRKYDFQVKFCTPKGKYWEAK